jgi:lysozyme
VALKPIHKKIIGGAAGAAMVTTVVVGFTPTWEGTDYVAVRDRVGTGHPITWCHGQTNVDRDAAHQVHVGQRFTKQQCDDELAKSIHLYLDPVSKCVHVPVPIKTMASIVDAAYNAGPGRVCQSAMVRHFNEGNIRDGCNAFDGWIVRGDGHVLKGLIVRRAGELHGDKRKSERALCLEGLNDPDTDWYLRDAARIVSEHREEPKPYDPPIETSAPPKKRGWLSWLLK